jgi:subtilisin family serine protease
MTKKIYLCGMKHYVLVILCLLMALPMRAQRPAWGKLSPMLRRLVRQSEMVPSQSAKGLNGQSGSPVAASGRRGRVVSFVKLTGSDPSLLRAYGCQPLAQVGRISIAAVPVSALGALSRDARVVRIEAERSANSVHTDSMALHLNALPAYAGTSLPQAYTGRGVLVGVEDIGFDLTHPNFYDAAGTTYRIRALWDQLSTDTVGSPFIVGRDYRGQDALLALQHSRDGLDQTHGTHTTGIAAGSGASSAYRGMAWESDICLVANASSEDIALIDTADYDLYTYATDALGFKYIFDTADSLGMPCVVNFSEGSQQDYWGYDQLYYELLDSLLGPGHILVSSAGNSGEQPSYLHKAVGQESTGIFVGSTTTQASLSLKTDRPFTLRLTRYGSDSTQTLLLPTDSVVARADSAWTDSFQVAGRWLRLDVVAYPNCYRPHDETVFDVTLSTEGRLDNVGHLSVEAVADSADVEFFRGAGYWFRSNDNLALPAGECTHNINSPSSSPRVICVGATSYRTSFTNYLGQRRVYNMGVNGQRAAYSSVGPTYDGRIKPDVMAPGTNIISSYSSFYLEQHPTASDIASDVEHFSWQGRIYAWNSNAGTSMSSPAVAGAVALWLQARPTLTPEDVLDVISHTSSQTDTSLSYPNNQWGYGQIDVYAGLLYVLGLTGVEGLSASHVTHFTVRPTATGIRLTTAEPAAQSFRVSIYTVAGQRVLSVTLPAGQTDYQVAFPGQGVFAVQVEGDGSELIRR